MLRDRTLHCQKAGEECKCRPAPKGPLVSICSDDLAAALTLPNHWTPRHCGPNLTNYLEKQKQNHNNIYKSLAEEAIVVNKTINDRIRETAEILLALIKNNQKEMDCVVENCQEKVIPPVEDGIRRRRDAFKQIKDLFNRRGQDILDYRFEANALERQRADGLKNVLQRNFQKLIAIGYLPPKDLMHGFDERMYGVNQQLLCNARACADLEAKLRAQLDRDILGIRSSVNQMCFITSGTVRRRRALPCGKASHCDKRSFISSKVANSIHDVNDSCHHMTLDLGEFQSCVTSLVDAYRGAIMNVFDDFFIHLEDLQDKINNITFFNVKDSAILNMEDMAQRAMHRISDSCLNFTNFSNRVLVDMTKSDLLKLHESLHSLGNRLRYTYTVLHDASLLLNPHMLRTGHAQKLILTAVEDMQTNYDNIELANEIPFNIALEQMRSAPDADKVGQQYDNIMFFFEKTIETFFQHKDSEVNKLEEFMNLQLSLSNTLLSEYHCFLEKNPKTTHLSSEGFTSPSSCGSIVPMGLCSLHAPLPRLLMQTKFQNEAINNWMNGFLDSLENNIRFVPEKLSQISRKWVDEKTNLVNMRYNLKILSHRIRFERMKAARETRLAEISMHDTRLNEHLGAVYDIVNSLPVEATEFLSLDATELYPLGFWAKDIQQKINELTSLDPLDTEVKRLKMSSYAARLRRHHQLFEESLDLAIEKLKKELESRIQVVRISNVQFMAQLKLFNEKGRYSAAEAHKTCSMLVKAGDALENCANRTLEVLNQRRTQLLGLADQILMPLQRSIEDVVKSSGKPQGDKKKPVKQKK